MNTEVNNSFRIYIYKTVAGSWGYEIHNYTIDNNIILSGSDFSTEKKAVAAAEAAATDWFTERYSREVRMYYYSIPLPEEVV